MRTAPQVLPIKRTPELFQRARSAPFLSQINRMTRRTRRIPNTQIPTEKAIVHTGMPSANIRILRAIRVIRLICDSDHPDKQPKENNTMNTQPTKETTLLRE